MTGVKLQITNKEVITNLPSDSPQNVTQTFAKAPVVFTRVWVLLHISNSSLGPSLKDIKRISVPAPLQQHSV